ncbi:hypothetical protein [Brevundimonas sp. TWP1-2-1b1]|uniref:hypothetical protein n=1 Tax=unclassified Brevundimonas TaxID=2622653 RepID=UPI003CF0797B
MIHDLRDSLLALGGATVLVALSGLALDNDLVLNVGLKATGAVLITYATVALGLAVANVVKVVQTVSRAVQKGGK